MMRLSISEVTSQERLQKWPNKLSQKLIQKNLIKIWRDKFKTWKHLLKISIINELKLLKIVLADR